MALKNSVTSVFATGIVLLCAPFSLLAQGSDSGKGNSTPTWIPRPKIYQVQSSIEASKKDALRARGEVREEYLGILSDVEEAIKTARQAASRRQQQEVINRINKLGPELDADREAVEQHRQTALNELKKGGYRQGEQMPSKPSRFMRKRTAVQRITPPEMSFEPRKSPSEVMSDNYRAKFREGITLNPIRWFWRRGKKPELISGTPTSAPKEEVPNAGVTSHSPSPRVNLLKPDRDSNIEQPVALPTVTAPAVPEPEVIIPVETKPEPIVPLPDIEPVDVLSLESKETAPVLPLESPEFPVPTLPPLDPVKDILNPIPGESFPKTETNPDILPDILPEPEPERIPAVIPIPDIEIPDIQIPEPLPINESPEVDIAADYMKEFEAYSQSIQEREERILKSIQELNELLEGTEDAPNPKPQPKAVTPLDKVEDKPSPKAPKSDQKDLDDEQPLPNEDTKAILDPTESKDAVEPDKSSKFKTRSHRLRPN